MDMLQPPPREQNNKERAERKLVMNLHLGVIDLGILFEMLGK